MIGLSSGSKSTRIWRLSNRWWALCAFPTVFWLASSTSLWRVGWASMYADGRDVALTLRESAPFRYFQLYVRPSGALKTCDLQRLQSAIVQRSRERTYPYRSRFLVIQSPSFFSSPLIDTLSEVHLRSYVPTTCPSLSVIVVTLFLNPDGVEIWKRTELSSPSTTVRRVSFFVLPLQTAYICARKIRHRSSREACSPYTPKTMY